MEDIFDTVRAVTARVSKLPTSGHLDSLTAAELSSLVAGLGRLRHETERVLAWSAAEVNRRSRVEFGGAGLAKAAGYANSEAFIAVLTGTSKAEARKIDRLGRSLMQATDTAPGDGDTAARSSNPTGAESHERPWFTVVTELMVAGTISPDRCEAIRAGLGNPTDTITNEALASAARRLLDLFHPDDSPETVFRDARQTRALLDRDGAAENETTLHERQEAKVWTSRDGMVHLRADFAPEDGAWVKNTLDLILGPRIGGPRFAGPTRGNNTGTGAGAGASRQHNVGSVTDETHTDDATSAAAAAITDDPRTTEQLRASTLLNLLKAGTEVDDNAILARKRPTVHVIITADELTRPNGDGVAFIEGSRYPVTKRTIDRLICDTGYTPLTTNPTTGSPLDLGRDVRLFTPTQRTTLATLQGGCIWNGCTKPPSMCEAHHIDPWSQHGKTNIHDGVLLCRYHHQQLHNHNWHITRTPTHTQPATDTTDIRNHTTDTGSGTRPAPGTTDTESGTRPTPGTTNTTTGIDTGNGNGTDTHTQPEHAPPRYENSYWLIPPPSQDPEQTPIPLRFRPTAHPLDHAQVDPPSNSAASPTRVA